MIIRRQINPENKSPMEKVYANGMEFKPIYKKTPQPNSTSNGTTIMRDVDDLLKPIHRTTHNEDSNDQQTQYSKERTERNLWRNEEVMEMLYTMQQVKALEKLNDKTVKSENVFKEVEVIMHRNGFVKKSHVQIWTKWKFLKSTYMTSKRNGVIPRIVPPQVYEMIHQMVTGLSQSLADSCSSLDGDSTSASGMVISGVEGGLTNEKDDDSFGMAHPIFGFRLGMVKSEPADTGYEPLKNNSSDKDPLEEESLPSKTGKEAKEVSKSYEAHINKEPVPVEKVLEIPHRGRGRPPKNPPAATLAPNNTSSLGTMPPLRVAPFAKAIQTANSTAANRPPPPLTMPPSPRIRVADLSSLKDADSTTFSQPKLIPKPLPRRNSPPLQPTRISKEISAQTRSSSTPSPSYPKMKQIPMRKTPYSLRPDRAIPDLEASLSPPPPAFEKPPSKKLEEVPTTKHLVMQSSTNEMQNIANRKRRTDWQDPVPSKQAKYNKIMNDVTNNSKTCNDEYDKNYGKVLQNVIIDLSSSLRKMQTDMMRDFFNKQNELLEREHKFQMQQDHLIMKAFQEQTQEIMHSVNQLVGSIKSHKNCEQNDSIENNNKEARPNRERVARVRQIHAQEQYCELVNNDGNGDENQVEDEDQDQDNQIEQDAEETYTDDDQQQDQIQEDDDENEQEENAEEQAQLSEKKNQNGVTSKQRSNGNRISIRTRMPSSESN